MKALRCNFLEDDFFCEGSQATSIHPSGKNNQMARSMEHFWNDTDREKNEVPWENFSPCLTHSLIYSFILLSVLRRAHSPFPNQFLTESDLMLHLSILCNKSFLEGRPVSAYVAFFYFLSLLSCPLFVHKKITWTGLRLNSGLRSDRLVSNSPSHGTSPWSLQLSGSVLRDWTRTAL